MKAARLLLLFVAACTLTEPDDPMLGVDAGTDPTPDAPPAPTPPEPTPAFTAGSSIGGSIAIDDAGIRPTFSINGVLYPSQITVSLTETATSRSCGVTLDPKFVTFSYASTSTRQFKTVVIDLAASTMLEDTCGWDDAYILQQLGDRFGTYIVGFAQARFAEDRPYVDVYLNASKGLGNATASIVRAGGGAAYQMAADGSVVEVTVQPTPGTLLPALYDF
jgi:hypothetical protein